MKPADHLGEKLWLSIVYQSWFNRMLYKIIGQRMIQTWNSLISEHDFYFTTFVVFQVIRAVLHVFWKALFLSIVL